MPDYLPPHNLELEESLLATIFLHADDDLFDLSPSDLYRQSHQIIYQISKTLYLQGNPVDVSSVTNELIKSGNLGKVGGGSYLSKILDSPPCIDSKYTISQIKGYSDLRRMIEISNATMKRCYAARPEESDEIVNNLQRDTLGIGIKKSDNFCNLSDLTFEVLDHCEELSKNKGITGIPSGYDKLDFLTCGWQPSDLIILAGRPSMGKTAFALNSMRNAAINEYKSDFYSLEMARLQIAKRLLAMESRINSQKFRNGNFSAEDWDRINTAAGRLHSFGITIDDTASASYQDIQRKARKRKKNNGTDIIWIDYLSFIEGDKGQSYVREIESITRGFKSLSKELEIPIVLLCQLNRLCEQRPNKRPILSDLRDSGAIEQDADVVLFLYRDEVYNKESEHKGIAEVNIVKQRNGPTGTIALTWLNSYTKFEPLANEEHSAR